MNGTNIAWYFLAHRVIVLMGKAWNVELIAFVFTSDDSTTTC